MFKNITLSSLYFIFMFMTFLVSAQNNDPTKPLSAGGFSQVSKVEAATKAELILESIIHGFEVHTAVINGQVLKVGGFIRQ